MKAKISVIIPAYNTGNYIENSLMSVIDKQMKTEIIVVDDGSTDNTQQIVESLKKGYDNITFLQQEHKGPSSARNAGLDIAQGEYIAFLDSDDTLVPYSLKRLYAKAIKRNADVVVGSMNFITSSSVTLNLGDRVPQQVKGNIMDGQEYYATLLTHGSYNATGTNMLYRNDWLKEQRLRFTENILFEDELWTMEVLNKCKRLYCSSINYYNYYKRSGSITNSTMDDLKKQSLRIVCERVIADYQLFNGQWEEQNKWNLLNLIRICKIALARIGNVPEKDFFLSTIQQAIESSRNNKSHLI